MGRRASGSTGAAVTPAGTPQVMASGRVGESLERAALLAACAAVWMLVAAPGGQTSQNPPQASGCSVGYQGSSSNSGSTFDVSGNAGIVCHPPGGQGYGDKTRTIWSPPPNGTACVNYADQPVKFNDPGAGGTVYTAPWGTFTTPTGGYPGPMIVNGQSGGGNHQPAFEDAKARYAQNGTWQNGVCDPGKNTWSSYPVTYIWIPHTITSPGSPAPSFMPWVDQIKKDTQARAGTVGALPTPDRGLVNLPQCFWVQNIGIAAERDVLLVLAGPPDATGRQIFYNFVIRVRLVQPMSWDFGDNDPSQVAPPPACGDHAGLVAHQYHKISAYNPGGRYPVHATEQYTVTVDEMWDDSNGVNGPFRVYNGTIDPPPQTPDLNVYVGQLEGVNQQG